MGHFYTTIQGIGMTQAEAQANAIGEFLYEEGQRHNVRGIDKAVLLKKVPPLKTVETRKGPYVYVTQVDDPTAPPDTWRELWQFELHTHA